jgi:hypothetical protein
LALLDMLSPQAMRLVQRILHHPLAMTNQALFEKLCAQEIDYAEPELQLLVSRCSNDQQIACLASQKKLTNKMRQELLKKAKSTLALAELAKYVKSSHELLAIYLHRRADDNLKDKLLSHELLSLDIFNYLWDVVDISNEQIHRMFDINHSFTANRQFLIKIAGHFSTKSALLTCIIEHPSADIEVLSAVTKNINLTASQAQRILDTVNKTEDFIHQLALKAYKNAVTEDSLAWKSLYVQLAKLIMTKYPKRIPLQNQFLGKYRPRDERFVLELYLIYEGGAFATTPTIPLIKVATEEQLGKMLAPPFSIKGEQAVYEMCKKAEQPEFLSLLLTYNIRMHEEHYTLLMNKRQLNAEHIRAIAKAAKMTQGLVEKIMKHPLTDKATKEYVESLPIETVVIKGRRQSFFKFSQNELSPDPEKIRINP